MTGSTHANHRSAGSPRLTPEGPTLTTPSGGPERVRRGANPPPLPRLRSGAGTRSLVLGRPPRAPRSRQVNPGAQAPGLEKGTTASGKPKKYLNKFCSGVSSRKTEQTQATKQKRQQDRTPQHHTAAQHHGAQHRPAGHQGRAGPHSSTAQGAEDRDTHSTKAQDAHGTKHSGEQQHTATHHGKAHTARGDKTKHSAGRHRTLGRRTAPQGTTQRATAPNRAKENNTAHKNTTPRGTTRRNRAQHSTQGHTTAQRVNTTPEVPRTHQETTEDSQAKQ